MEKFDAEKIQHQFLNTAGKFGTNSQIVAQQQAWTVNGGYCLLWAGGWLLLFLGRPHGDVHAKSANNGTQKKGLGHSNTMT